MSRDRRIARLNEAFLYVDDVVLAQEKKIIEGFKFADGEDVPVTVSVTLEKIQRGEEAYRILVNENKDIPRPNDGEEYIIFTFNISYDDGELDEIYMMENRASFENAGLYFALSNIVTFHTLPESCAPAGQLFLLGHDLARRNT